MAVPAHRDPKRPTWPTYDEAGEALHAFVGIKTRLAGSRALAGAFATAERALQASRVETSTSGLRARLVDACELTPGASDDEIVAFVHQLMEAAHEHTGCLADAAVRRQRGGSGDAITVTMDLTGEDEARAGAPPKPAPRLIPRIEVVPHEPVTIGDRDEDGNRTFAPPGEVCGACSQPDADPPRWVPVSECPAAMLVLRAREEFDPDCSLCQVDRHVCQGCGEPVSHSQGRCCSTCAGLETTDGV